MSFKDSIPAGFKTPTALPGDAAQNEAWQRANRDWWEKHPMRYDWRSDLGVAEFSKGFYDEIDRRFFGEARKYLPWDSVPFDPLIDFAALGKQDVLEIGVGSGSHAGLLAARARSYTGIDITEYAVRSTSRRLECFGLKGTILRMDAEKMDFPDGSFDFIWTWGVIHHSANTGRILEEMRRVLRPGGTATVMVYHRSWWNYLILAGLCHGVIRGRLLRGEALHEIQQKATDGAIARHYTRREWNDLVRPWFRPETIVLGSKPELFPLPASRIKSVLMDATPDAVTRFFLNWLGWGTFLVSRLYRET